MVKRLSAVAAFVGMLLFMTSPVRADSLMKVQVTCYAEPGKTYSGSSRTDGIIASKKEWQGCIANVWQVDEDGEPGEFLGIYEILDIGYGHALEGSGTKSDLCGYEGEPAGTVETGLTFDFRQPDYDSCLEFMNDTFTGGGTTGSEVFVQLVRGEG